MKVAITGHTKGLGLALKDKFLLENHSVIGFSRTNGYDIGIKDNISQIINLACDCDIFINNACFEYAQCDILFQLASRWQGLNKKIVNISSGMVTRTNYDFRNIRYRNFKVALEDANYFLANKYQLPKIMIVQPCLSDTNASRLNKTEKKLGAVDFANILYENIFFDKNAYISSLSFKLT